MSPDEVAAARARNDKATAEVVALCEGTRKWTMRIPAEPDRDSDLLIGAALNDGAAALDALAESQAECERMREALDACDRATYGWTFGTAFTVIEKIRLVARSALGDPT